MGKPVSERTHKKSVEGRAGREGRVRPTHPKREERRERALDRQEERDARTDAEQLQLLIARGYPDCKEAERLRDRIKNASNGE